MTLIIIMTHFSSKNAVVLELVLILICFYAQVRTITPIMLHRPDNTEDDTEYFLSYVQKQSIHLGLSFGNPLFSVCLPLQNELPNLTSDLLRQLDYDIARGTKHGRRLARGLASAIRIKDVLDLKPRNNSGIEFARLFLTRNLDSTRRRISDFARQAKTLTVSATRGQSYKHFNLSVKGSTAKTVVDTVRMNHGSRQLEKLKIDAANFVAKLPALEIGYLEEAILEAYGTDALQVKKRHDRRKRGISDTIKRFVLGSADKVVEIKPKPFLGLLMQIGRLGVKILDYFYMSPEFILNIPGLGEKILNLREQGRPLYQIIDFIRHVYYLYKVSKCPKLEHRADIANDRDPNDCVKENDPHEVEEAKKVVTESGSIALSRIASNVGKELQIELNEEGTQEFISRSTYAILSYILPQPSCRIEGE